MTGWDKFLHLLRIFGLLGWDATTTFNWPVTEMGKSSCNLSTYSRSGRNLAAWQLLRGRDGDMSSSLAAFYFVFVIVSSLFSREENPLWHFWTDGGRGGRAAAAAAAASGTVSKSRLSSCVPFENPRPETAACGGFVISWRCCTRDKFLLLWNLLI